MDHESFDRLARLLGKPGSRRAALRALLGAGALGVAESTAAKGKNRNRNRNKNQRRKSGRAGSASLTAEAVDCLSPGPSSNMSGCNYNASNFSDGNLSSSRMVGTTFVGAVLFDIDLSSSNLKDADFSGANLIRADLSSSNLTNTDFPFANLCDADLSSSTLRNTDVRSADLRLADLHSTNCNGLVTDGSTLFCGTIDCNGNIRNDNCPPGGPGAVCCGECPPLTTCINNVCEPIVID